MVKYLVSTLLFLVATYSFAQQAPPPGKISVTIVNSSNTPLEGATAELLRAADNKLVKTELSNRSGLAEFEKVPAGMYKVRISMVHHIPFLTGPFTPNTETQTLPLVTLQTDSNTLLKNVTVTAQKPFIQKLTDRIVVNVENSIISAGSSALDVLERSPGISVDQNDAISLRGRAGVRIMIDGKITPMAGADLATYLKGLPANAIERIEIITNPSAKYDAAGNSGLIDIRMKKDQRLGANGTVTAGYGQGVYPKANAGTTFNYRNKMVNVFGNYNYSFRKGLNHLLIERNFYRNGSFIGGDEKDNYMVYPLKINTARLGADFFPSKKTIIGFVVNSNFNTNDVVNKNNSLVINSLKQPATTFKTAANSNNRSGNTVANINVRHTFDSTGKELTADVDYGVFTDQSLSNTITDYYLLNGAVQKPTYILNGDQDGRLTLKTAKADYVHPLKSGVRLEGGFKTSFVSSDNDARFYDASTGIPVNDTTKTNHFKYKENNHAAYINFSRAFKKFDVQFGLRGEQTNIETFQEKGSIPYDSGYFQLFPSAFFNYKIGADKTIGVSVSRRIDRPDYESLNPFLGLIDVSTYATGRPGLLPQLTWSYEVSYTHKQLNFTLGYSHTKDLQTIVIIPFKDVFPKIPLTDTNVTVQVPVNLRSSDYTGLSIAAPVRITRVWNMIGNASLYYISYQGNLANTPLSNGTPAARLTANNTFTLKKGWTTEMNATYSTRVRNGYMVLEPQWGLSAGVQKSVLKNKGTVRFNITDIFWTNLPRATITYTDYIEDWHAYRETRVANLAFTYRFGNSKVAAARRRTTASEEELRRAGAN